MATTTSAPRGTILAQPERGPEKLVVTLLDDEVVELETRNWDVDFLVESIFRRGHFKVGGRYISAGQIKSIVAK